MHTLKTAEFESYIHEYPIVFIDFWATWCAPCKQFAQVYEEVAKQHEDIQFAKVNVEEEPELAEMFQIRSIPHLLVFKQGIMIYSDSGSMPESVLNELVTQARSADVSEIKMQMDE